MAKISKLINAGVPILALGLIAQAEAQSIGGCSTYTPVAGDNVTCTPGVTPAATSGVQTPSDNTGNNDVTVNIQNGTFLNISGSPVGIGSASTVTNEGRLSSQSFFNGYGISFGANGRSAAGGNTVTNTETGVITTGGGNSAGIYINATNVSAAPNSITNRGSVSTSGSGDAYGIRLVNRSNVDTIINTGSIVSATTHGIFVRGAATITNSGSISGASNAIYFDPGTANTGANTVILQSGSTLSGSIVFNTNKTSETLVFDGLSNINFNNGISGANNIRAINNSSIVMNSSTGYSFGAGTIQVDADSQLTIDSTIRDPSAAVTSLTKTGAGALTLTGANTYSGGTTVSAGTLIGNTTSLQGAITNNAAVTFNQTTDGTYAGVMSGSGALTKTGAGVLTLTGANTYSGGTTVSAGTLVGNATSLQGAITNNAAVTFNQTTDGTYAGVMSGSGALTKTGAGVLTLTGANTYTGNTFVQDGSFILNGSITSNVMIASTGTLQGFGTINGSVTNSGNVQPGNGLSQTNLTITGNYIGNGGTFTSFTHGDPSVVVADTLSIGGSASGSTLIVVRDAGSLGQPTTGEGILLVRSASSTNNAFQAGRIAAGAYEYKLVQKDGNWYLKTSENNNPALPADAPSVANEQITPQPGQRVETALYPALPALAKTYIFNTVDSFDQRRGDLALMTSTRQGSENNMAWGRLIGKLAKNDPGSISQGPMMKSQTYGIQLGLDVIQVNGDDGSRTTAGPFITMGRALGAVSTNSGLEQTGNVSLSAYSFGLNATHFTASNHYFDFLVQGTRFINAQSTSLVGTSIASQGWGFTGSAEVGYRITMNKQFDIVPQAQIIYNLNQIDPGYDQYSKVTMPSDSTTIGRIGAKLSYKTNRADRPTSTWLRMSALSTLRGQTTQTTMSNLAGSNPTNLSYQAPKSWMAVDLGANYFFGLNQLLYVSAGFESSISSQYTAGYIKGGYTHRF